MNEAWTYSLCTPKDNQVPEHTPTSGTRREQEDSWDKKKATAKTKKQRNGRNKEHKELQLERTQEKVAGRHQK